MSDTSRAADTMQLIAANVEAVVPDGAMFMVLVITNEGRDVNYVGSPMSLADRASVLRAYAAHLEGAPDA